MTKKKSPAPDIVSLRYVGGISPVSLTFPSTGRSFEVARGEVLDLLPAEAKSLAGRFDFESPEKAEARSKRPEPHPAAASAQSTPTPTPTPDTEETPS